MWPHASLSADGSQSPPQMCHIPHDTRLSGSRLSHRTLKPYFSLNGSFSFVVQDRAARPLATSLTWNAAGILRQRLPTLATW